MAWRRWRGSGRSRVLLVAALLSPIVACSEPNGPTRTAAGITPTSAAPGVDVWSAAPGCDAPMEQMTEACNDEINRHHLGGR